MSCSPLFSAHALAAHVYGMHTHALRAKAVHSVFDDIMTTCMPIAVIFCGIVEVCQFNYYSWHLAKNV
jgi:hypothetical protein